MAQLVDAPLRSSGAVEFHYWDGHDINRRPPDDQMDWYAEKAQAMWARAVKLMSKLPGGAAMMRKPRRVVMLRRTDKLPHHQGREPIAAYVWHGGMKLVPGTSRAGDVLLRFTLDPKSAEDLSWLIHELGHAYWYEVVQKREALAFIDAHQEVDKHSGSFNPKAFVSPYAWSSPEEDFAESIRVYLLNPPGDFERKPEAMTKLSMALKESTMQEATTPKALYHVTFYNRLSDIASRGLVPDARSAIGVGGYAGHSKSKTFLTVFDGVSFWYSRARDHAENQSDDVKEDGLAPVVLRIKNYGALEADGPGTRDATDDAFTTVEKIPASVIDVWTGSKWVNVKQWRSVDDAKAFDPEEVDGETLWYFHGDDPLMPMRESLNENEGEYDAPRGVLLIEGARGVGDLPDNIGVVVWRAGDKAKIIYTDMSVELGRLPNRTEPFAKKINAPGGPEEGIIRFEYDPGSNGPCDGAWAMTLSKVVPQGGWGPLLYDAALECASIWGGGLTPDRYAVSPFAHKVWEYYAKRRNDVTAHQLDTRDGEHLTKKKSDDCAQTSADDWAADTNVEWHQTPESKRYTKKPDVLKRLAAAGKLMLMGTAKLPIKLKQIAEATNMMTVTLTPLLYDEFTALEVDTASANMSTDKREFVSAMEKSVRKGRSFVLTLNKAAAKYLFLDSYGALSNSIDIWKDQASDGEASEKSRMRRAIKQAEALRAKHATEARAMKESIEGPRGVVVERRGDWLFHTTDPNHAVAILKQGVLRGLPYTSLSTTATWNGAVTFVLNKAKMASRFMPVEYTVAWGKAHPEHANYVSGFTGNPDIPWEDNAYAIGAFFRYKTEKEWISKTDDGVKLHPGDIDRIIVKPYRDGLEKMPAIHAAVERSSLIDVKDLMWKDTKALDRFNLPPSAIQNLTKQQQQQVAKLMTARIKGRIGAGKPAGESFDGAPSGVVVERA